MRISDWSSDVCSSDLLGVRLAGALTGGEGGGSEQQQGRGESRHRAGQVAVAGRLAESLVIELVQLRPRRRVVEVRCFPVPDRVQARQVVGPGAERGLGARKRGGLGKEVTVRLDPGGGRVFQKKKQT